MANNSVVKQRSEYPTFLVLFFALNAATIVTVWYALTFNNSLTLRDFIAGHAVFHDNGKAKDIAAIWVFLISFVASFLGVSSIFQMLNARLGSGILPAMGSVVLLSSLPTLAFMGDFLATGRTPVSLIMLSAAIIVIWIVLSLSIRTQKSQSQVEWVRMLTQGTVVGLLSGIAFIGIAQIGKLFGTPLFDDRNDVLLAGLSIGLLTVLLIAALGRAGILSAWIRHLSIAIQLPLPLLFLTLIPVEGTARTNALSIAAYGLVLIAYAEQIWRWRRGGSVGVGPADEPIAWTSWLAVICIMRVPAPIAPIVAWSDYQMGEVLTPWYQWKAHHLIPYIDLYPPRGLSDFLIAAVNDYFYAGTAATGWLAVRLTGLIAAGICFIFLSRFAGVAWALIAVLIHRFTIGYALGFVILALFLLPAITARPRLWLSLFGAVIFGCFFISPLQVAAASLALLPIAVTIVRASPSLKYGEAIVWLFTPPVVMIGIGLASGLPILTMTANLLTYLWENSLSNNAAYGIAWYDSFKNEANTPLFFELSRMTWFAFPVIGIGIILWRRSAKLYDRDFLPLMVAVIYCLLLVPYAMGRIDIGDYSRPGLFSNMIWALVAPMVLIPLIPPGRRSAAILAVAIPVMLAPFFKDYPASVLAAPLDKAKQENVKPYVDGTEYGLSNLGAGLIDAVQLDRSVQLKTILDQLIAPDETYLDLTNRTTNYFHMARRLPIPYLTPYNAPTTADQVRIIGRLEKDPPPVVLLRADNLLIDGASTSLRAPLVYRYVMENYRPVTIEDFDFAIHKARWDSVMATLTRRDPVLRVVQITGFDDQDWDRGVSLRRAGLRLSEAWSMRLTPGTNVLLADGQSRTVLSIEGSQVWLSGDILDPITVGYPHPIRFQEQGLAFNNLDSLQVLDVAFRPRDSLLRLPSVWGYSVENLRHDLTIQAEMDLFRAGFVDVTARENLLTVTGPRPQLTFDLIPFSLSGQTADMLVGQLRCEAAPVEDLAIRLEIQGQGKDAATPETISFIGGDGYFMVPLNSYPRIFAMQRLDSMTLSWDPHAQCHTMVTDGFSISQRRSQTLSD